MEIHFLPTRVVVEDIMQRSDSILNASREASYSQWISFVAEVLNATLSQEVLNYVCYSDGCRGDKIGPVTVPSLGVEAAF